LPFVQGLYPPYKDPVEKDSFKSKGTILSSINTSSVQKWKIPPKESPVPGKKKKIKKKISHLPKGVVFVKEQKRTGGSLDGSLTFGQPRFKLCRVGFICWSVVVEPASGWWVYTRAANWWASVPISKNRPALVKCLPFWGYYCHYREPYLPYRKNRRFSVWFFDF